jgi:hypothetical protein
MPNIDLGLIALNNYEEGCVDLAFTYNNPITDLIIIKRASEDNGYNDWVEITRKRFDSQNPSLYTYRDFTVK